MATHKATKKKSAKSPKIRHQAADKVRPYTFIVEVEVTAWATSEDEAKTLAEDCVLSGNNGCDAGVLQSTLVDAADFGFEGCD